MTTLQAEETSLGEIDSIYETLQKRFSTRVSYDVAYRTYNLKQLAYLIEDNRPAIHAAVESDLGGGDFVVDVTDVWPILNEIELAVKRLPTWVKDETRVRDSLLSFKSMNPRIHKQPKGVSLIISAWNYPWQLTLIPVVNAIAAGCPCVIKPSELAPASAALMAKLIPMYLDPEAYAVVQGGVEQSTHLLKKQWGHIIYTGSDRVGKIVAKAAADTLTPTTLELGGKSPVFVSSCADLKKVTRRMFTIKQMTIGQMCVSPDYILCEQGIVDEFIAECSKTLDTFFPPYPHPNSMLHAPMGSHIRSDRDYERQLAFIKSAEDKGQLVYRGEMDSTTRRMGISLVKLGLDGVDEKGGLVEEEIFGPVLPIIPVSSMDKAIEWVNARPHPLAAYVCASKKAVFDKIVNETISGSVVWNDFAFATLALKMPARSLPFGGVGGSGWGGYHGYDGFKTFSHFKSTLTVPYYFEPLMSMRYPPLTNFSKRVLTFLLKAPMVSRPKSVEDEARKLQWRKWRGTVWLLATIVVAATVSGTIGGRR